MSAATNEEQSVMNSPQQDVYFRFVDAFATNDIKGMRAQIHPDFTAKLPGIEGELSFDKYLEEIARQRTAFSDLGKHTLYDTVVENGTAVHVEYRMLVTFDGPLASREGRAPLAPTGNKVIIHAADLAEFDPNPDGTGKIVRLTVVSNRQDTIALMLRTS